MADSMNTGKAVDILSSPRFTNWLAIGLVSVLVWNANGLFARIDRLEQNQQAIMFRLGICPDAYWPWGPEKSPINRGSGGADGQSGHSKSGFLADERLFLGREIIGINP
jgi:hypothetical protein